MKINFKICVSVLIFLGFSGVSYAQLIDIGTGVQPKDIGSSILEKAVLQPVANGFGGIVKKITECNGAPTSGTKNVQGLKVIELEVATTTATKAHQRFILDPENTKILLGDPTKIGNYIFGNFVAEINKCYVKDPKVGNIATTTDGTMQQVGAGASSSQSGQNNGSSGLNNSNNSNSSDTVSSLPTNISSSNSGTGNALLDAYNNLPTNQNLGLGSQGSDVSCLQNYLNGNGENLIVNGIFDALTKAAVSSFQSKNPQILKNAGVTSPTGYWGTASRNYVANTSSNSSFVVNVISAYSSSAPTVTLTASQTSINSGDSVTLNWNSKNAALCTGTNLFTTDETSGEITVNPNTTTAYTVTCTGTGGSNSSSVIVNVSVSNSAPKVTLIASSAVIQQDQSSNLIWSSTNAKSCSGSNFTANGISGTVAVTPNTTTTYTITCTGTTNTNISYPVYHSNDGTNSSDNNDSTNGTNSGTNNLSSNNYPSSFLSRLYSALNSMINGTSGTNGISGIDNSSGSESGVGSSDGLGNTGSSGSDNSGLSNTNTSGSGNTGLGSTPTNSSVPSGSSSLPNCSGYKSVTKRDNSGYTCTDSAEIVCLKDYIEKKYPALTVCSTCRSAAHNAKVGGSPTSAHLRGQALDACVKGSGGSAFQTQALQLVNDMRLTGNLYGVRQIIFKPSGQNVQNWKTNGSGFSLGGYVSDHADHVHIGR